MAQIEEVGFDQFWKQKEELIDALEKYCERHKYLFSALLVTDVTTQNSMLVVAGEAGFVAQVDYPKIEPSIYELREVVSRKKQLLPYLTHCLKRMRAEG